ncbi:EamA family transporter [Nocardia rhamnosiphila]|uniref:DMT family transporter n=1 Tax=Nocardia rhamnosiphila TaxID=426716 RepID=A0ABV2WKC8_9NOCA|nr:DMT family transporter [Nocardia rhamnosiphila]
MMIVLALGAAVGWGVADFLGGVKSRTIPLLSVLLVSQTTALGMLAVIAVVRRAVIPDAASLGWAVLAGAAETCAIAALYRGMAVGVIALVAAFAAFAPVVPLLAGMVLGEVPGVLRLAGLGLALAGLLIGSYRAGRPDTSNRTWAGIGFGLLAAAGFGTFFVAMDTASAGDIGWALLTARLTAVGFLVAAVVILRHRVALRAAALPSLALIGGLIVVGDALYATASALGMIGIVAVLGSLHTFVTIALARIFLREELGRHQQIGIATALSGVLAISIG